MKDWCQETMVAFRKPIWFALQAGIAHGEAVAGRALSLTRRTSPKTPKPQSKCKPQLVEDQLGCKNEGLVSIDHGCIP